MTKNKGDSSEKVFSKNLLGFFMLKYLIFSTLPLLYASAFLKQHNCSGNRSGN
nr:MAG TPA: hypothetical protein [Herelleviridae sp.]